MSTPALLAQASASTSRRPRLAAPFRSPAPRPAAASPPRRCSGSGSGPRPARAPGPAPPARLRAHPEVLVAVLADLAVGVAVEPAQRGVQQPRHRARPGRAPGPFQNRRGVYRTASRGAFSARRPIGPGACRSGWGGGR